MRNMNFTFSLSLEQQTMQSNQLSAARESIFFKKDIAIIESKIKNILINYNYPIRSSSQIRNKYIALLPLKLELIVWYNTLKIRDFKRLLLIPFYLIKRQIIFFRKNSYNKNKLPYSVGTKN